MDYAVNETKTMKNVRMRILREAEKMNAYEKNHSIHLAKSKYIGCPYCESKLKRIFVKGEICPVCYQDLRSKTTLSTIERYKNNIKKWENQYEEMNERHTRPKRSKKNYEKLPKLEYSDYVNVLPDGCVFPKEKNWRAETKKEIKEIKARLLSDLSDLNPDTIKIDDKKRFDLLKYGPISMEDAQALATKLYYESEPDRKDIIIITAYFMNLEYNDKKSIFILYKNEHED